MPDIDHNRLAQLEAVVERGAKTVVDVAAALSEIRENRLYKATHSSFSEYVEARFGFGKRWANMLIKKSQPELPPAEVAAVQEEAEEGWELPDESSEHPASHPPRTRIDDATEAFAAVLSDLRELKDRVLALATGEHSAFLALPSITALLTNLHSEIVWGQPSQPCPHEPFDRLHADSCQCRGANWLPRSQTQEGKARGRGKRRN